MLKIENHTKNVCKICINQGMSVSLYCNNKQQVKLKRFNYGYIILHKGKN